MLLGIISDTHDRIPRTIAAIKLFHEAGVETILHCGDICGSAILNLFAGTPHPWPLSHGGERGKRETPFYYVMGNNDEDAELRQAAQHIDDFHYLGDGDIIELAGRKLGITHGHQNRVLNHLMSQQPRYLFSGHTHVSHNQMHQGVQCINPGAIHRASEYSVALLNLATDDLQFLPVPSSASE
jgi:uncharacterized protein